MACTPLKITKVSGLETLSTTLSWLFMSPGLNGGGTIFNSWPWQKEPVSTSASNTQIRLSLADVFLTWYARFLRFLVKYMPAPYLGSDERKKVKGYYDLANHIAYVGTNIYSLSSPPNNHHLLVLSLCVCSKDTQSCSLETNYHWYHQYNSLRLNIATFLPSFLHSFIPSSFVSSSLSLFTFTWDLIKHGFRL